MKIIEWEINQYRSIEEGRFEMDDFTVLIGKNNSGKSNIIDSLRDFKENHKDMTTNRGVGISWTTERSTGKKGDVSIEMSLRFEFSEEERSKIFDTVSREEDGSRRRGRNSLSAEEMREKGWISELEYQVTYNSDGSIDVERYVNFDGKDIEIDNLHRSQDIFGASIRSDFKEIAQKIESWAFVDPFREPEDDQTTRFREELDPSGKFLIQVLDSLHQNYGEVFSKIDSMKILLLSPWRVNH